MIKDIYEMPKLNLKHIVSFSSEDQKHPAENLIKPETYFKWKSATPGERQVSAIVQLQKASKIHSIDIGNNGSAFVEVLVGRSSWAPSEEFKVLQPASSFMSPADSKANKNLYRVRMFGNDGFTKAILEEKWDQLKFVCTQPYNQSEAYGLSFITIHSPPDPVEKPKEKNTIQLGRFKLRSNSDDDEDTISTGSFFRNKSLPKQNTETPKRSMAATCRDARTTMLSSTESSSTSIKTKGELTPSAKTISISNDSRGKVAATLLSPAATSITSTPKTNSRPKTTKHTPKQEKTKRKIEVENRSSSKTENPPSKKAKVEPVKVKKVKTKRRNVPRNKILDNVVFVLSGYVNPQRGQIRDLATEMGARFSQSWDSTCTHLICAFKNTPKFRQIKGKGKIVRETWINACHKAKRRLNTQRLDGGGESSYESTDSEDDTKPTLQTKRSPSKPDDSHELLEKDSLDHEVSPSLPQLPSVDEEKKESLSSECDTEKKESLSSECDTEDELEKLRNEQKQQKTTTTSEESKQEESKSNDAYNCTTDDEEEDADVSKDGGATTTTEEVKDKKLTKLSSKQDLNLSQELPDFFEEKGFLLYGKLDDKERRLCKRYITAYGGTLHEYMGDAVTYVLSNNKWDENFDQALNDNKGLVFVRPAWLFECHKEQRFVGTGQFVIPPKN